MARNDIYLNSMLRHLGAAYYESLHGRATRADVTRAVETVEEHLKEDNTAHPAAARPSPHLAHHDQVPRHHRWACRVRDVMTTSVVTVDRITPYKEIDRLLAEHKISGVPVLTMGRHVAGVVSEADLVAAEDKAAREVRIGAETDHRWRVRKPQHTALTAGALMTAPAVTIHPDATIPGAARVMTTNRVSRLPVVDPDGKLIGIVSRRDLLSVFLRPDPDITADVQQVLDEIPFAEPADITALVRNGVVTLTGTVDGQDRHHELTRLATRLIWDVDGVVDVVNHLSEAHVAKEPEQAT